MSSIQSSNDDTPEIGNGITYNQFTNESLEENNYQRNNVGSYLSLIYRNIHSKVQKNYLSSTTWFTDKNKFYISFLLNVLFVIIIVCSATVHRQQNASLLLNNKDKDCTKAKSSNFTKGLSSNNEESLPSRNCIENSCLKPNTTEDTYKRNCIINANEPCNEFQLTSNSTKFGSGTLQDIAVQLSLGRYVLQEKLYNGRPVYKHTIYERYLYWLNTTTEIWIVGSKLGNTKGWIANTECNDVQYPANGKCIYWWLFAKGSKFVEDSSIRLTCKGCKKEPFSPSRKNNAIDLKIWNPSFRSSKGAQYLNYRAVLDTGNSGRYPMITEKLFTEFQTLNIIKNNTSLSKSHPMIAINNKSFFVKTLKLQSPLTFLTSTGSEIKFQNFYIQDDMFSDINICKFAMSELGVRWDLNNEFVYINNEKIPLISYD